MNEKLVTVGIPTYNRSTYVVKAVQSALAQTHPHIEVVVSDNASTDDTALRLQEIQDPRLVFIRQPKNLGMIGNFNACLKAANGSLFLMLPDDDILEPQAIEQLIKPFLQAPADADIGLTWCPCVIVNPNDEALWTTDCGPRIESPAALIMGLFNGTRGPRLCSVMVLTADAIAVGGYDGQRFGALCDTTNWCLASLRHKAVACINEPMVKNMWHAASSSSRGAFQDWLVWGENMYAELWEPLGAHGVSQKEIRSAKRNMFANNTMTILLPNLGQPGWFLYIFREIIRQWRNFLTPFAARRLFFESWKIMRFWQRRRLA